MILVTVAALERQAFPVRCLARHPEHLLPRVAPGTEVVRGDVLDRASLDAALVDVDVVDPVGLAGLVYWWGIYRLHQLVFRGMLAGITRAALRGSAAT